MFSLLIFVLFGFGFLLKIIIQKMCEILDISFEDFKTSCRTCLLKQPIEKLSPLTPFFKANLEDFFGTGQLNNHFLLPTLICNSCKCLLNSAIQFKSQIRKVEERLNVILLKEEIAIDVQTDIEKYFKHSETKFQDKPTPDTPFKLETDSCSETDLPESDSISQGFVMDPIQRSLPKSSLKILKKKKGVLFIDKRSNKMGAKLRQRKQESTKETKGKEHENINSLKKMHHCPDCSLKFKYDCGFKAHLVKHDKLMKCEPCGTLFKSLKIFEQHIKQHPQFKPFDCLFCEKKFAVISTLKKHRKLHDCDNPFLCKFCGKRFVHGFVLKNHLRIHTGERPFKCNMCEATYSTSSFLVIHKRTHTMERPYQCQACSKAFISKCALMAHVKTHTKEKKFMCPMCGKGAARLPDLMVHMRFHTGERPYLCDQCPKAFATSSNLSSHKRTHTGIKNHVCKVCSKAFGDAQVLKRHFRIHTGERPYECKECGKRYMQSSQLKIHQKSHSKFQEKAGSCTVNIDVDSV